MCCLGQLYLKQAFVLIFCLSQIQEKGYVKCNKLDRNMVIDPPSATLQCYNFLTNNKILKKVLDFGYFKKMLAASSYGQVL